MASDATIGGESGAAAAKAQGACEVSFIDPGIDPAGIDPSGIGMDALDMPSMPGMAAIMSIARGGGASIEHGISGEANASAPVFGIQPSGNKPRSRIPASAKLTARARMAFRGRERERAISVRKRGLGGDHTPQWVRLSRVAATRRGMRANNWK